MEKKKNIFSRILCNIGKCLKFIILSIIFGLIYIFVYPFVKCKVSGKENVNEDDEARVFIYNHYEMFGPAATVFNFPYKFRPWIIDKMINEKTVEEQMGLLIYSQYKGVPKWIKKIILKCVKSIMVYAMKAFKGIPVSRDNLRANLETMKISSETLSQGKAVLIGPEKYYVKEGVGPFMMGFEHIGKYHYQKTGKRISFYPMFISYKQRTIYIGKPIKYDPEKETNLQKLEIVKYLRNEVVNLYFDNEIVKPLRKNKKL